MSVTALTELGRNLPRVAEEGVDSEAVEEATLVGNIADVAGGQERAEVLVGTVRRMFLSLSLLDEEAIGRGVWRMVSFPALLCARSLLSGLGDEKFRMLEKGFWEPSEYRVDRQRAILRQLEIQRRAGSTECQPIRRVWVAWALMASDDRFLLVRREDSSEREGNRGRFVLPGGRVASSDLGGRSASARLAFFDPAVSPADGREAGLALKHALVRELHEELELGEDAIASISASHPIIRYVDLEGAASAHALTEYHIQVFRIALTDSGKERLLRSLAKYPERYSWFTVAELLSGKNARGDTAFVDALRSGLGPGLEAELDVVGNDLSLGIGQVVKDPFDLPGTVDEPFLTGATGSERAIALALDDSELADLKFLAAVRRGDPISEFAAGVSTAPFTGWLLIDDDALLAHVRALATSLKRSMPEVPLISFQGRAVRLNVQDPESVFFSSSHFSTGAWDEKRGKTYRIRIEREAIRSRLGVADALARETRVSEKLGTAIYGLLHGDATAALDSLDTVKRVQRTELRPFLNEVGARLLIRQVDGVPELSARPKA